MTPGNFLGHVRSHTAAWEAQVLHSQADLPLQHRPRWARAHQGLHKDTHDHNRIAYILHCSWGQAFLIGKAKLLFRHIFNRETRCNWLKSNQTLKVDRRVRTLSLVTMDNNAMEKTSN